MVDKLKSLDDLERQERNRKADAEIDLMERIQAWCDPSGPNLHQPDAEIAAQLEEEFGIPKEAILREFNSEDHASYATYELVWRAGGLG